MKLLLVAPTCDGQDVGEAEVTYQWVHRLAARHDVTLLTYHKRGSTPAAEQIHGARVVEWTEPPLLGRYERLNSMLKPGYVPFYLRARRWVRRAVARGERFDLAHQISPVALRYPSPLAGSSVPYLVGPTGGSLDSPPAFATQETGAPWFVALRGVDGFRLRHDPLLRASYAGAACVLGIGDYVREALADVPLRRFEVMPDTGIDALPPEVDRTGRAGPVRLLFVGRLIRTKGVQDALRALALVPGLDVVLDVVGQGYDRAECERLVAELDLGERVVFHGQVPHARVESFFRAADVFLFPSYREPGGIAVAEAMSYGLPAIVCDRGGPAAAVADDCGIRVAAHDPEQYARDLAAAVSRLVLDGDRRATLGRGARARVADRGLWDRKVERLEDLYRQVLAAAR
ncbi:glycosyltransferase family 4 protein [Cellulomonas hominis]